MNYLSYAESLKDKPKFVKITMDNGGLPNNTIHAIQEDGDGNIWMSTNKGISRFNLKTKKYQPKNKIRVVTAASLFDGHDASINIMRRIIQSTGAEVIHLGHDRSAQEVVECAIQEDANAIALTSYQGGHMEYFKYMHDLLYERGCGHIRIFGGGGGVILPEEIKELHAYGICRIYAPDDGRSL